MGSIRVQNSQGLEDEGDYGNCNNRQRLQPGSGEQERERRIREQHPHLTARIYAPLVKTVR